VVEASIAVGVKHLERELELACRNCECRANPIKIQFQLRSQKKRKRTGEQCVEEHVLAVGNEPVTIGVDEVKERALVLGAAVEREELVKLGVRDLQTAQRLDVGLRTTRQNNLSIYSPPIDMATMCRTSKSI
jgi:hypothetical protein